MLCWLPRLWQVLEGEKIGQEAKGSFSEELTQTPKEQFMLVPSFLHWGARELGRAWARPATGWPAWVIPSYRVVSGSVLCRPLRLGSITIGILDNRIIASLCMSVSPDGGQCLKGEDSGLGHFCILPCFSRAAQPLLVRLPVEKEWRFLPPRSPISPHFWTLPPF